MIYQYSDKDTGPKAYNWVRTESMSGYENCGKSLLPVDSGCCWRSLVVSDSTFASMMVSPMENNMTLASFVGSSPVSAVGSRYCTIEFTSNTNHQEVRYILDNGLCEEGLTCDGENEIMSVYSSLNCAESVAETYSTSKKYATFSDVLNSTISIDSVRIASASQKIIWNGYLPSHLNVVSLTSPSLIVTFNFLLFALSTTFVTSFWICSKLYTKPSRRVVYQGLFLSQIFALTASVILVINQFAPQVDFQATKNISKATHLFQALATLTSTLNNVQMLGKIFSRVRDLQMTSRQPLIYIAIVSMHIVLTWPYFFTNANRYWISIGKCLWHFLTLLFNFACLLAFVSYRFLKRIKDDGGEFSSVSSMIYLYMTNHVFATLLLIISLLNMIAYIVIVCITNFSLSLGNDTLFSIFCVLAWIPILIDSLITVWLFEMTTGAIKDKSIKELLYRQQQKLEDEVVSAAVEKKIEEKTVKLTIIPPLPKLELLFVNEGNMKKRKTFFGVEELLFGGRNVDLLLEEIGVDSAEVGFSRRNQRALRDESMRSAKQTKPTLEEEELAISYKAKKATGKHSHTKSDAGSYRFGYGFGAPDSIMSTIGIRKQPDSFINGSKKTGKASEPIKSKLGLENMILSSRMINITRKSVDWGNPDTPTEIVASPIPISPEEKRDSFSPLSAMSATSVPVEGATRGHPSFRNASESSENGLKKKRAAFTDE